MCPDAGADDRTWDERYSGAAQIWSGRPNGALVAEVAALAPGTALDVGCGEGADAIWLAGRGWSVTALDVSRVALDRAATAAAHAHAQVRWLHAGLLEAGPLQPGLLEPDAREAGLPAAVRPSEASAGFDLVSAQYPALRHTPGHDAERALIAAVAPGGVLLVVHHADVGVAPASADGFDPRDYIGRADVAALLDSSWQVRLDERRPRDISGGAGAQHTHDVVLHARRAP